MAFQLSRGTGLIQDGEAAAPSLATAVAGVKNWRAGDCAGEP